MLRHASFIPWRCANGDDTNPHPTAVCEPINLACACAPRITYVPRSIPHPDLSTMQHETISQIFQSFECRSAFLLGDATGVGKGRTIAGVVRECVAISANYRVIWVSANKRLETDARCEIATLGLTDRLVVQYVSYSSLHKTRLKNLIEWTRDQPHVLIVLDECHLLRNRNGNYANVHQLRTLVPQANVLYSSATAVSLPRHLHYLEGLEIWGVSSPFKTYPQLVDALKLHGMPLMELLAIEMRSSGAYIARQLSLANVSIERRVVELSNDEHRMYNAFVRAVRASDMSNGGSVHQSVFQRLITGLKTKYAIDVARDVVNSGKSVVISVVNTGEAQAQRIYNTDRLPRVCDSVAHLEHIDTDMYGSDVDLPTNPIDHILDTFGHDNVAELTGRTHRYVRDARGVHLCKKPDISIEADAFRSGCKKIAILSRAGGVGISLHDKDDGRPRVHIILELPWSAEDLVQQMGRVYRSNCRVPPSYILLVSNIPAELRFANAIATKLKSMGALIKADHSSCQAEIFQIPNWDAASRRSLALYFAVARAWKSNDTELPEMQRRSALLSIGCEQTSEIQTKQRLTELLCADDIVSDDKRRTLMSAALCLFPGETVPFLRGWNMDTHHLFPFSFRVKVRALLLCHRAWQTQTTLGILDDDLLFYIVEFMGTTVSKDACKQASITFRQHDILEPKSCTIDYIFNRMLGIEIEHQHTLLAVSDLLIQKTQSKQIGCLLQYVQARAGSGIETRIVDVEFMDMEYNTQGIRVIVEYSPSERRDPPTNAKVWMHYSTGRACWTVDRSVWFVDGLHIATDGPAKNTMASRGYCQVSASEWPRITHKQNTIIRRRILSLPTSFYLATTRALNSWKYSMQRVLRLPVRPSFPNGAIGLLVGFED